MTQNIREQDYPYYVVICLKLARLSCNIPLVCACVCVCVCVCVYVCVCACVRVSA